MPVVDYGHGMRVTITEGLSVLDASQSQEVAECGELVELGRSFELSARGRKPTIMAYEVIGQGRRGRSLDVRLPRRGG